MLKKPDSVTNELEQFVLTPEQSDAVNQLRAQPEANTLHKPTLVNALRALPHEIAHLFGFK